MNDPTATPEPDPGPTCVIRLGRIYIDGDDVANRAEILLGENVLALGEEDYLADTHISYAQLAAACKASPELADKLRECAGPPPASPRLEVLSVGVADRSSLDEFVGLFLVVLRGTPANVGRAGAMLYQPVTLTPTGELTP